MSTADKTKLRELAEKAGSGEWGTDGLEITADTRALVCCGRGGYGCCGEPDVDGSAGDVIAAASHEDCAAFIAAANPATVLALLDEIEALRTCLAETAGVAVTMLYESHKADTIKEFTVEELSQMVETTKHLADANVQVEEVYRKAWNMTQGGAERG